MAVLVVVSSMAAGRYIARNVAISPWSTLLLVTVSMGAIVAIRSSMVFPIVGAIVIMLMLVRSRMRTGLPMRLFLLATGIMIAGSGPLVTEITGGTKQDFMETIRGFDQQGRWKDAQWSKNSLGARLIPANPLEAVIFVAPRMTLYMATPLPQVGVTFNRLVSGSWSDWENLMTVLSSILNLVFFPYAIAGFAIAWRQRRINSGPLAIHLSYWMTFLAIAGGNVIVHGRYRLMATLLLFACVWLGFTMCRREHVIRVASFWFGFLTICVLGYTAIKNG
jgi:hypothetical protein